MTASPRRGAGPACALAAALALCLVHLPWPGLAAGATEIVQKGRAFLLREVEVARGEAVRFVNGDEYPHQINIRGPGVAFDSNLQGPEETIEFLAPGAGTFEVRCGVHPRMRMTLRVR